MAEAALDVCPTPWDHGEEGGKGSNGKNLTTCQVYGWCLATSAHSRTDVHVSCTYNSDVDGGSISDTKTVG
jgi:hypothetical protein